MTRVIKSEAPYMKNKRGIIPDKLKHGRIKQKNKLTTQKGYKIKNNNWKNAGENQNKK